MAYSQVGKSYATQRKFCEVWAAKKPLETEVVRRQSQESIEVDEKVVTYLSLTAIWREEGGTRADWPAALNYVSACIKFAKAGMVCDGRPLLDFNSMTMKVDFAYIKKGFRSSFEQKWKGVVVMVDNTKAGDAAKPVRGDANSQPAPLSKGTGSGKGDSVKEEPKTDTPQQESTKRKTATPKQEEKNADTPKKDEESEAKQQKKKVINGLWQEAKKMCGKAQAACSQCNQQTVKMTTGPDWKSWAAGKEKDVYDNKKKKPDQFFKSSNFWLVFLTTDLQLLRRKFNDTASEKELAGLSECGVRVDALLANAKRLTAMAEATKLA